MQKSEENLFDARGTESKQEWPNAKPKTERQPPPRSSGQAPTDIDFYNIFKHDAATQDRIERWRGCRKKILHKARGGGRRPCLHEALRQAGEGGDF